MDLHVIPNVSDDHSCRRMAEQLALAGYSIVGLTLPTGILVDRIREIKRHFQENGIETVLRVDLSPGSRHELLRLLRRFRRSYDIVSVKCSNQNVSSVAARDGRVDVLFFDSRNHRMRFNHTVANLLQGALEFNLVSTLLTNPADDTLARLTNEARVTQHHKTKVVLSSGSSSPSMVRSPSQLFALGRSIGLSKVQCRDGVSTIPCSIVNRNLERRSDGYVEEGVRIVLPRVV